LLVTLGTVPRSSRSRSGSRPAIASLTDS
jgi:hypothetical protein